VAHVHVLKSLRLHEAVHAVRRPRLN
jgi:hypothetical protein